MNPDQNGSPAHIPLMSEADYNATIANQASEILSLKMQGARMSRLAQQNAETADLANKAAESLSKQLEEAKKKIAELTPPPAEPPAEADPLPVIPPAPGPLAAMTTDAPES